MPALKKRTTFGEGINHINNPPKFKIPKITATPQLSTKLHKIPINKTELLKVVAELPEQVKNIKASVQLRHDFLQSQKRANYVNELNRLTGEIHKLPGLTLNDPRIHNRTDKLKQITNGNI